MFCDILAVIASRFLYGGASSLPLAASFLSDVQFFPTTH